MSSFSNATSKRQKALKPLFYKFPVFSKQESKMYERVANKNAKKKQKEKRKRSN